MSGQLHDALIGNSVFRQKVNIGNVGNQRVKFWALFGGKNSGNGFRKVNIGSEPVNRFGRKGNQSAGFDDFGRAVEVFCGYVINIVHVKSSKCR